MLCNIAATAHASQGTVRLYTGASALQHFAVIFPRSATSGTCVSQKCVTGIPYLSDLGYVQVPKASLWGMPILVVRVQRAGLVRFRDAACGTSSLTASGHCTRRHASGRGMYRVLTYIER